MACAASTLLGYMLYMAEQTSQACFMLQLGVESLIYNKLFRLQPAVAGSALRSFMMLLQSLGFPQAALHVQLSLDAMVVAIHIFDSLRHSSVLCLFIAVLMVKMPAAVASRVVVGCVITG